jgi:hypothetical protein
MYNQTVGLLAIYINKYLQTKNKVIKTYEAMYVDTDRNKFAASPNFPCHIVRPLGALGAGSSGYELERG